MCITHLHSCGSISDEFQAPSALPSKLRHEGDDLDVYLTCIDASAAVLVDSEVDETVEIGDRGQVDKVDIRKWSLTSLL